MRITQIPIGFNPPEDINVVVEVSSGGSPVKYELDKSSGSLIVDRYLRTPMVYPGNYGFVPQTLSLDGDPIDVLICDSTTIVPGAVVNCRPIGVLIMKDEAGMDEKIIAVPSKRVSSEFDAVNNYPDLPNGLKLKIDYFFEHYKDLEQGKWVEIDRWEDAERAKSLIVESIGLAEMTSRPKLEFDLKTI